MTRKVMWTNRQVEAVRFHIENGLSVREIAARMRRSENSVYWAMRKHGIKTSIYWWTGKEVDRLREMAEQGKTCAEISKALNRTMNAVSHKAAKNGISLCRSPAVRRARNRRLPKSVLPGPLRGVNQAAIYAGRLYCEKRENMALADRAYLDAAKANIARLYAARSRAMRWAAE